MRSSPGSQRTAQPILPANLRALLLAICVCSAVPQARAEPSAKECPDLTGTYEVRLPAWADKFPPFGRRARVQTALLATIQRRDAGFTLIWHASRQEFLAAARSLAQRDPNRYGTWRERTLRDPGMPLPMGVASEHDWLGRLAGLGPVFRGVDEILPPKQCKRGWFLVFGPGRRAGPPDFEGGMDGTRELEIWLGRDKDGSLNLKVMEYRTFEVLRPYKGQREVSVRLGSSERLLEQWPVAPAQDLTPIRAEELPEGPSRRIPKCRITADHEALFFQRLKANLPPKAEIENRSSSIHHGGMRPDGNCDPTPYTVTISAPDAAGIAKVAEYLRTDPFIRRIDSQESQTLGNGRLMVKFRMMAAP